MKSYSIWNLPDGLGIDHVRELDQMHPIIDAIIVTSGNEMMHHSVLKAGADSLCQSPFKACRKMLRMLISQKCLNRIKNQILLANLNLEFRNLKLFDKRIRVGPDQTG